MLNLKPIKNIKNPYNKNCVLLVGTPTDLSLYEAYRIDTALTSASMASKFYEGKENVLTCIQLSNDVSDEDLIDAAKVACKKNIDIRFKGQTFSNCPITYGFSIFSGIYQIKPIKELKQLAIDELMCAVPFSLTKEAAASMIYQKLSMHYVEAQEAVNRYKDPIHKTVLELTNLKSAKNVSSIHEIDFALNRVNLLRAPMSLGKTTKTIDIAIDLLFSKSDAKIVYISHLEILGKSFRNKIQSKCPRNISICDHTEKNIGSQESASVLTTTVNSLPGLLAEVLESDLIIFDECEKGILATSGDHFRSIDSKHNSYDALKYVVENAKWLIMMDADISENISCNFIKSTEITDYAIYNVEDYSAYKSKRVLIKDRSTVLMSPFKNRLYAFDNLKMMYRKLKLMGYHKNKRGCYKKALEAGILVVCSDTKSQPEVMDFVSNPNIEAKNYDKIFYSPYIGCGVSIETLYSDVITIISNSVLNPNDLIQLALRFRAVKEIHFAVSKDRNASLLPSKPRLSNKFTFDDMLTVHEVQSTILRSNMPLALIKTLEALEFVDVTIEPSDSYNHHINKQSLATRNRFDSREEAIAIVEAKDISEPEAIAISESGKATNEEKASADKAILAKEFGISSESVSVELVKFDYVFKLRNELLSLKNSESYKRIVSPKSKKIITLASSVIKILGLSFTDKVVISNESYLSAYSLMKNKDNQVILSDFNGVSLRVDKKISEITQIKRSVNQFLKILGFSCKNEGRSSSRKSTAELHPFSKLYLDNALNKKFNGFNLN
ncbi:DEAD/DEAH box helicase family protein [Vibrio cholerae]|nr:DEAD/DEAH box helicase family protein [Vibrio cholerae]ELJ8544928.1 DEAD/DEAH box helicase family protein [Vibrio cholerae]ELJ8749910.1 DEAD/DEAH box helicase family protein [Vibrio cholerae]